MRTARRRIALQSVGPLRQLDLPPSERGSLAGVEDLGDAEQISDAGADLSFALQGWTAFVATRRRKAGPLGPPASPPAFQPKLDSAVHPLPRQAPSSGDG